MPEEKSKLVYSTDQAVPRKEKHVKKALRASACPAEQKVIVRLDRKGRGGKSVTVIEGLQMPENEQETLLKQLKARLGTGGALKNATLEIQGDHRDILMATLEKMGYRPKLSGG